MTAREVLQYAAAARVSLLRAANELADPDKDFPTDVLLQAIAARRAVPHRGRPAGAYWDMCREAANLQWFAEERCGDCGDFGHRHCK